MTANEAAICDVRWIYHGVYAQGMTERDQVWWFGTRYPTLHPQLKPQLKLQIASKLPPSVSYHHASHVQQKTVRRVGHLTIAEAQSPQALPRWRVPEVNFVVIPRRGQYDRVRLVHLPCLNAADRPPSPASLAGRSAPSGKRTFQLVRLRSRLLDTAAAPHSPRTTSQARGTIPGTSCTFVAPPR